VASVSQVGDRLTNSGASAKIRAPCRHWPANDRFELKLGATDS